MRRCSWCRFVPPRIFAGMTPDHASHDASESGRPRPGDSAGGSGATVRTILLSAGALAALVLLWQLAHVLLLLFGGTLLGVVLHGAASKLSSWSGASRGLAVVVAVVVLVGGGVALGWLVGPPVADQVGELLDRLPAAVEKVEGTLEESRWGRILLQRAPEPSEMVPAASTALEPVTGIFTTLFGLASSTLLVLAVALFLAVSPRIYLDGALRLVHPGHRDRAERFLNAAGRALNWWMVGRLVSMTVVGVLTTAGLWIVGAPLPLSLGFIAGGLSFVPILGPVASATPAVLLALPEGTSLALWVVVVFLGVQVLETNLITPLVQESTVSLPPVLLIAGQVVLGVLFGFLGVLLATPVMVATVIGVQVLYVEGVLGEDVAVLGVHGEEA